MSLIPKDAYPKNMEEEVNHVPLESHAGQEINLEVPQTGGKITHYLLNFTGQGEPARPNVLSHEIGKALAACGVDLLMATTYVSHIAIDPREIGIKDTWMKISDGEKRELVDRFPHLCTAIDLICGVTSREG